ncbi:hypothetical protein AJ79_02365 [Helicocarpus griseus UAMH5409]|uniref:Carboxylic ester hydrolase n=1 Tax=Helicocarpus griseus UAMH5409 TaxID=1447875 RepID=A0A2B7Y3H6_9EURO|nr:hypothetical protein AJ79_02365 [Helicocarpus griseus UAMH5409]
MVFSNLLHGISALVALASTTLGAELTEVTNFGPNPSNAKMNIYVPDNLAANPAVIVALHGCMGTGEMYYRQTQYPSKADASGSFIVIYPSANNRERCWDVATDASLIHDGGSDSLAIVSMVQYTIATYAADASRVFVTGSSSGGMMTNVLCAAYPDVFAAGSGPISADSTCADGEMQKSPEEWGQIVREMYPGYEGSYPRFLTWHGTRDWLVKYPNLQEQLDQWSNVFGLEWAGKVTDTPEAGYTEIVYGDGSVLKGYRAEGVGHTVPVHEDVDLAWFGIV